MRESTAYIESRVRRVLGEVLPEVHRMEVPTNLKLINFLDIDETDFAALAAGLGRAFEVHIPDSDIDQLDTIASCSIYIERALGKATLEKAFGKTP